MLGSVRKQVAQKGMTLEVTEPVLDKLAKEGFDPQYGARPLRRAVQRLIEDPLVEEVLIGRFSVGDTIRAEMDGEGDAETVIFRKGESSEDAETGLGGNDSEPALLAAPRGMPELPPPSLN